MLYQYYAVISFQYSVTNLLHRRQNILVKYHSQQKHTVYVLLSMNSLLIFVLFRFKSQLCIQMLFLAKMDSKNWYGNVFEKSPPVSPIQYYPILIRNHSFDWIHGLVINWNNLIPPRPFIYRVYMTLYITCKIIKTNCSSLA